MALRVLLADESSTIKKVMQLALQDFGIEVKAVPIGLDVMQVARSFNPDIVFADVLLAKRNGYDVSADLKNDPQLKRIPVVLMWSGFMELDEAKATASRADRRLEKPFDAETLRSLVKDLVPALGTNKISDYLSFPQMPEFTEEARPETKPAEPSRSQPRATLPQAPPSAPSAPPKDEPLEEIDFSNFNFPEEPEVKKPILPGRAPSSGSSAPTDTRTQTMRKPFQIEPEEDAFPKLDELEEPEEFQSIPLPKNQGLPPSAPKALKPSQPSHDDWARQDLSKYKIELPKDDLFAIDEADLTHTSIALTSGVEEISLDEIDNPEPRPKQRQAPRQGTVSKTFSTANEYSTPPIQASLDPMRAEELLRQEARAVLENVAWKLLPEIVERVVREELQKLLKDAERL